MYSLSQCHQEYDAHYVKVTIYFKTKNCFNRTFTVQVLVRQRQSYCSPLYLYAKLVQPAVSSFLVQWWN